MNDKVVNPGAANANTTCASAPNTNTANACAAHTNEANTDSVHIDEAGPGTANVNTRNVIISNANPVHRVVVTGLGVISPVGNSVQTMWSNLIAGKHGIAPITRFDAEGYKASLAAEVKDFNAQDYFERSEARRLDLYSQYALAAAAQAMTDSGIEGAVEPERLAVYFGSGIGGIGTFENEHEKLVTGGPRKVSPLFIPMLISNLAAGNIAIRWGARGSCVPVVTACATGTDAIGQAYRAIKHGYASAAIAGGSEASITPMGVAGFVNMTAMTTSQDPDAASLPFDKRRSGFIIGEGAGALILEDYDHAVSRGARIYAEIAGYGSTCDAHHITAPSPDGASSAGAIKEVLREAAAGSADVAGFVAENHTNSSGASSVSATAGSAAGDAGMGGVNLSSTDAGSTSNASSSNLADLIYINAHGTGTPLNDASETRAIKLAFDNNTQNVLVSSTKSMTGHMLGAAGAVEAVISILALRESLLPPTIGLLEPDPECDLDYIPLTARKASPVLSMSVSLGFGGHNACLAFKK